MSCVNRSSKDFKALAARNNVAINTLELFTHKYWRETGNETKLPTDVYIQAQLGNGHYLEKGPNVRKLWNLRYNTPKEFNSMESMQAAYNEAAKYFPKSAIIYYKNEKGNFVLSVKRPVEKEDYTKDDFFDDFDNMGSLRDVKKLDLGIKEKQTYSIDKVQELYNKFNTDKTSKALADRAFNIAKELGLQITFDESLPFGTMGRYTSKENSLRFKKSFLERDMMNSKKAPIMLHEVLHALSMYALSNQTKNWKRSEDLESFRTEMNSLYQDLKSNPLLKGERGIVDLYEFVAELANPVFRDKIKNIDREAAAEKKLEKKSFWSRIVDAFKKLLGLHITNTYYQRSMNALEKAFDAFDIDTYMRYNGIKKPLRDGYNAKEWEFNSMSDTEVKSNVKDYFDKKTHVSKSNLEINDFEIDNSNVNDLLADNVKADILRNIKTINRAKRSLIDTGDNFLYVVDHTDREGLKHLKEDQEGFLCKEIIEITGFNRTDIKQIKDWYDKEGTTGSLQDFNRRLERNGYRGSIYNSDSIDAKDKASNTNNVRLDKQTLGGKSLGGQSAEDSQADFSGGLVRTGYDGTTHPRYVDAEVAREFLKTMSAQQIRDELSTIKQESADYNLVNGIEEEHKHSGKAVPTVFMFADGTKINVPFTPNAQQVDALNEMDRFMKSHETSMTLSGYAGTGKTSLMEIIAKKSQKQGRKVEFCASTNKAAAVLNERVSKAGFKATTLNKVFGISVEIDPNSKSYNAKNLVNNIKDSEVEPGTTVIIDEASMINEENYGILNRIAKERGLKIIYVGDEAQLAPVNENQISKVFRNGDGKVIRLTQVERTDDNAILKEATDIRNGKPLSKESSFNSKGEGVAYISPEHQDAIDEVIEHYVKGLKQDSNYFRILAYTNKAVAAYNNQVRELLGYNTPIPQRGEPMTGYNNWGYDWRTKTYRFINSESYKVVNTGYPKTVSTSLADGTRVTLQAIPVTLEDSMGHQDTFNYMDIKSNSQNRQTVLRLANEKKMLWAKAKQAVGKKAKAEIYAKINDLDKFLFVNDNIEDGKGNTLQAKTIDFGYAMTVHKSQGSTFTHVLMDDADIARGTRSNNIDNAMPTVELGEESSNVPSTNNLKSASEEIDLGDLSNVEEPSKQTTNLKQQLEYVGVSRATDTVTVISNGVKKEGSPLHPEKTIKEDKAAPQQDNQNTIPEQLIFHLKSQGINVKGRAAMEEFLKTHKLEYLQQAIAYGKEHPYENANHVGKIPEILSIVKAKKYNRPGTDAVTLDSENHSTIYLIDHSADKELTDILKDGDGFGIRKVYNVNTITKDDVREIIRNIASDYRGSEVSIRHRLQNLGLGPKDLSGINIAAELKMVSSSNGDMVLSRRGEWTSVNNNRRSSNGRESKEGSRLEDRARHDGIDLYTTPQGEVYGFVDKDGNIYLDETKISPEHPIHEYTHLWDRTVQQKNPKLWQRGVELMKQTSLWNEILNDANYGKVWQSMNLPQEKFDNLIASEVHARFTGEGGEKLLTQIAEKQGQSGIIAKLKQWVLDVWKDLKATFGNWSQEDLDKLTLKDFNHMPVRDLAEGVDIRKLADINSTEGTQNDSERFNNNKQSQTVISSNKTILSNDELKYWNSKGVGEEPRILVASEHSDPAFHVAEILKVLEGKRSVTTWQKQSFTGKDFAGLYLITKQDGLPLRKLLETKIPKLIHFSITGLGGTEYEPGVMKYTDLLDRIQDYIKQGLDPECVTIRIDPIVPGVTKESDIEAIVKRASEMGIKRIRFSVMDAYPKTIEAMEEKGLNYDFETYYGINNNPKYKSKYNFNAKKAHLDKIADFMLSLKDKYGITLGTCAEPLVREGIKREGCLSVAAVNNMLGTSIVDKGTANNGSRKLCSCYGGKSDALAYASSCASHCIYCYAKHSNDTTLRYYNEDGSLKDNVYTRTQGTVKDLIRDKRQAKTTQQNQAESIPNSYEGIITPDANTVFVFGSNPQGRHGAGAAKTAKDKFGAIYGQGEGLQGNAYALPTKDLRVKENNSKRSISVEQITENIKKMYDVARQNPSKQFKVAYTHGLDKTSLNGYTGAEMIKMFKDAGPIPSNVVFSKNWTDHWNEVQSDRNNIKGENISSKGKEGTQAPIKDPSIAESKPLKVSLPGYEERKNFYDDTLVDAEWKVSYLKQLDAQISDDKSEEEIDNILNKMDTILQATSEKDYKQELAKSKKKETEQVLSEFEKLTQQIDNLLEGNKELEAVGIAQLSATEIRHTAELIANQLSDLITELQQEGVAAEQYPEIKTKKDLTKASRKEIVEAIGIDNIIHRAKALFDSDYAEYDDVDTNLQADLITENWDAMMYLAADVFAMNEGFGISKDYSNGRFTTVENSKIDYDNFNDYSNDPDAAAEEGEKDEQEHWQVENRTIDVLNSMSALVRQGIHNCYQLDAEGNKVLSKWGIPERVNPREATNSILRWTQGALSLEDMITKLSAKQQQNPWVSQLIDRLSDTSGKETDFQSQFFGVMCKHFQPYSIVLLEDGKYHSMPVNNHPALSEAVKSITSMFKIGEHPLFTETKVNAKLLGSDKTTGKDNDFNLHKALLEIGTINTRLSKGETLDGDMAKVIIDNVVAICRTLGFPITEDVISGSINKENVETWAENLGIITRVLSKAKDALNEGKIKSYDPFKYHGDYSIESAVKKFLTPVTEKFEDTAISAFYDSGKMYQSYVTPSFMTKLMNKFKLEGQDFEDFVLDEYGSSEWFKTYNQGDDYLKDGWRNEWLDWLVRDPNMRKMFDHKVELNFNKHNYMRTMNDAEYALSLITEYFAESTDKYDDMAPAWYRIPMQSNKPSSEFIKFYSYRGDKYKDSIVNGLHKMFLQELSRIQTVRMRNLSKKDAAFIKNFDTNGRKFNFLPVLNSYLENTAADKAKRIFIRDKEGNISADNDKLARLLQKIVEGTERLTSTESTDLKNLVDKVLRQSMEDRVQSILDKWEKSGILEAAQKIKGIYLSDFDDPKVTQMTDEQKESAKKEWTRAQVENYLWNDAFASKNILQLTLSDIAFYKDAEDLQKRLAQLHAPGIRGRKTAIDYNGKRVSDGKYRTFILKDFDNFKSNIIANISEVFDRKIAAAEDDAAKASLESLKDSLVRKPGTRGKDDKGGKYWNINVTDAQGYSSPSSYRKKAFIFGKWSKEAEDIYQKLLKGDYNYTDLETAFQPLKPFVYSKLTKDMGVANAPIHSMQVPFQAKNAEYLLIMADAILKGEETSRPNLLRAVFRVMEDSEKFCPTKGIDTVQFESAIKSGLQGTIDIHQFMEMEGGEEAAYTYMMNSIFKETTNAKGERTYQNYDVDTFVHETSYDDYCLQQEVPEHFKNHSQAHGSQIRMIIPSDLDYFTTDENGNQVDNYYEWTEPDGTKKRMKVDEYKKEYERTIADNIEEDISTLAQELCLDSEDKKERNIALSKILQREILSSPRYGVDLIQACSVDKETGEFRIPKGDPIQAKRIEQLINSIIKNRINKQKIAGGPIVQVSNFGTSQQLHIRFNDKKGNLIPLEEDYDAAEHDNLSYKEYLKKNQGGIAYFEVFMPIWDDSLFKKFAKPNGSIDVEAIEALDPELLKMVSYRIPTEDKYSCAPMKVVGFMPREAGDAIMLPYELTEIDDSDFDVDKRYVMRKDIPIKERDYHQYMDELVEKGKELYKKFQGYEAKDKYIENLVDNLIKNPQKFPRDNEFRKALVKEFYKAAYYTEAPTSGRKYRDNKIVDMSYAVLTNEMTADKILNPGGFDAPKKMGYMVAAYKSDANSLSWEELQEKSIDELKDLSYTDKDLTFADTQVQFYKQNSAASSLIGVFAVNKVAHATLESNDIYLDVAEICGEKSFSIAGTKFDGRMQIDAKYDSEGNLIGKTLGSLVSASADAVKDPILNLMNVNMTTAGMLNTMLRLGMPFNDAALFLSQDVIERLLSNFNRENLNNYVSLDSIITKWLDAYRTKNGITDNSAINSQPLTKEELVEGLTSKEHEAIDYKVLLAYQKMKSLTEAMRDITFATRFNSISSAVGPLIVDNLIIEKKMKKFKESDTNATHFYTKNDIPVDIDDVFFDHPVLKAFAYTTEIAKNLFLDMPTGSNGFRNLLDSLPEDISNKMYADKKLLDDFSLFYQSYLLIQSGVVNPNQLKNYTDGFAKWFTTEKIKEKYPDNELIKAIQMNVTKKTGKPYLSIKITGMDEQEKERYRSAWIDLHKADPQLSQRLFNYCFFRGGIGFSPKTFMSLVPTYVKERLKSSDGKSSYVDTYRKFPEVNPKLVRDQFIRNNWDNNKLVPWRGGKDTHYDMDIKNGILTVYEPDEVKDVKGLEYIKTNRHGNTYLWRKKYSEGESKVVFELTTPLGNNGEYLEMSLDKIEKPLTETLKLDERNETSDLSEKSAEETEGEGTPTTSIQSISEESSKLAELADLIMQKNPNLSTEEAMGVIDKMKDNPKRYGKFLQKVYALKGLNLSEQEAIDEFKKFC